MRRFGRQVAVRMLAIALLALPSFAQSQSVACDPGDKEVVDLSFHGNHAFSSKDLALRVNTTASSWARRHLHLFGTKRCLDPTELPRDVYRLKLLYRNAGYYNARVDTVLTQVRDDAVKVAFLINEGPPIIVDSASLSGLDSVPDRRNIAKGLDLGVGKPFDVVRFNALADSLVVRLENNGYPHADVLRDFEAFTDSLRARVSLVAVPGPRSYYGKIDIDAKPASSVKPVAIDSAIVVRMLGIRPGELYRSRDLVAGQRNLYATGAYRHVEVLPSSDSAQGHPDSIVNLHVNLLEDYMRQVDSELGWATLDCVRARAVYTEKNFLREAKRLQLTGQLSKIGFGSPLAFAPDLCPTLKNDTFSDTLNYYVGATLTQPALFGTSAVPSYSVYRERRSEYLAYLRTTLIGGAVSVTKNVGPLPTPLTLGYTLEYGRTDAQPALLCVVFRRCDQASQLQLTARDRPLAIANAALARIRTNSAVDPTDGTIIRAEVRSSQQFLGTDPQLTFNKGTIDGSWYRGLGGTKVVAVRVRAGAIVGGASSADPAGSGARLIPPQERLYAGGANSVRGFQQNELGALVYLAGAVDTVYTSTRQDTAYFRIRGDQLDRIIPLGGNELFVMNFEYRVRDVFFPQQIQYTLFTDAGQVWRESSTAYLGFDQLKWTPGIGVRYFSPVGPIQVNVGYNPYPRPAGPVYYNGGFESVTGFALPLYCVAPGNSIASLVAKQTITAPNGQTLTRWTQVDPNATCPGTYAPQQKNTFLSKLTLTFSIGTDF